MGRGRKCGEEIGIYEGVQMRVEIRMNRVSEVPRANFPSFSLRKV